MKELEAANKSVLEVQKSCMKLDMNPSFIAKVFEISRQTVHNWVTGKTIPGKIDTERLKVLNKVLCDLIEGGEETNATITIIRIAFLRAYSEFKIYGDE